MISSDHRVLDLMKHNNWQYTRSLVVAVSDIPLMAGSQNQRCVISINPLSAASESSSSQADVHLHNCAARTGQDFRQLPAAVTSRHESRLSKSCANSKSLNREPSSGALAKIRWAAEGAEIFCAHLAANAPPLPALYGAASRLFDEPIDRLG